MERFRCLVCRSEDVETFLDFGSSALANKFPTAAELAQPEPRHPLCLGFCHGCGHVQLTAQVPPSAMFEDYLYISSASETLKAHFADLAQTLTERCGLGAADLVIDIGCNDATLLRCFRALGVRTLGVDPARNLAQRADAQGIERHCGFFDAQSAAEIVARWGRAKLITATNTFPHIPDLGGFVRGIDRALAPGGVFVVEAHYLVDFLEQAAFDTVYHEHVSYWALGPMQRLFERHGMEVVRAERLPIHHGQLRASVQRRGEGTVDATIEERLADERAHQIARIETWRGFAAHARRVKADLLERLRTLRRAGRRVAGYGAPAKASTLLEFLEIGPDLVEVLVDRSPLKQGRYTPGTHIPIVAPDWIEQHHPDVLLLLAWNFADEIIAQQAAFLEGGGRFLLPLPEVRMHPPELAPA
jgi:SAM-dependent methyltransferase